MECAPSNQHVAESPKLRTSQRGAIGPRLLCYLGAAALFWPILLCSRPAMAEERLELPGYVWAQTRHPSNLLGEEAHNTIVYAGFQQGVNWPRLSPSLTLNTFVEGNYSADRDKFDYNNQTRIGVGAQLTYQMGKWGDLHVGVRYDTDHRPVSNVTYEGLVTFARWRSVWPPPSEAMTTPSHLTLEGEAEALYPSSLEPQEEDNPLLQARGQVGYDIWRSRNRRIAGNVFGEVQFKVDGDEIDRYNSVQVAGGLKTRMIVSENAYVELGVQYAHERRWASDTDRSGAGAFANLVWWWW